MHADASEGARHDRNTIDVRAVVGDCVGNHSSNLGMDYRRIHMVINCCCVNVHD